VSASDDLAAGVGAVLPNQEGSGHLEAPFFEIGPKNLLRRSDLERLAWAAGEAGQEHSVRVVLTVPTALISVIAGLDTGVLVFGQGMDPDAMGSSVGRVTAEGLQDAGASGVMLNHDSHLMSPDELARTVERARGSGLQTIVCAGGESEAVAVANLGPTAVLLEPPELIGTDGSVDRAWIRPFNLSVRRAHPRLLLMHAGGVSSPGIARAIMRAGADGTGSTSGVLGTGDYAVSARAFVQATRAGWQEAQPGPSN